MVQTKLLRSVFDWIEEDATTQAAIRSAEEKLQGTDNIKESQGGRVCNHCGNIFAPDAVFCRKCGAQRGKEDGLNQDNAEMAMRNTKTLYSDVAMRAKKYKKHATITVEEIALKHGIPPQNLVDYLTAEVQALDACRSLPFTILLIISFAFVGLYHDNANLVKAVEAGLSEDIAGNANFAFSGPNMGHKAIFDVNSVADFWSWMGKGVLPLFWVQEAALAEGREPCSDCNDLPYYDAALEHRAERYSREKRGVILYYDRMVLGIRMSQERYGDDPADVAECPMKPTQLAKVYDKDCVGGKKYTIQPELADARRTPLPLKRVQWLFIHDDYDDVQKKIEEMELSQWIDEKTQKVEVAYVIYNGEYGLHSMIMCGFFFTRGGRLWKDIIPLSAYDSAFNDRRALAGDAVWVTCLLYLIIHEVSVIVKNSKTQKGFLLNVYLNPQGNAIWNIIHWGSCSVGIIIVLMFVWNIMLTGDMNDALEDLGNINETANRTQYRDQGLVYWNKVETAVHFQYYMKLFSAMYPLAVILRLFKAFNDLPVLAVVTQTMKEAFGDLAHFLIIFMSVFILYAVSAVVLYGRNVPTFTTMVRSVCTCFRIMLGDFDWEEMRQVGRLNAFMWLLPFTFLIVMVLLNMLIAIVMDTYNNVKDRAEHADSLFVIGKKLWSAGGDLDLETVLEGVNKFMKDIEEQRLKVERALNLDQEEIDFSDIENLNMAVQAATGGMIEEGEGSHEARKVKAKPSLLTDKELRAYVPNMRTEQRMRLMSAAIMGFYNQHKPSTDLDELCRLVHKINDRTRKLKRLEKEKMKMRGEARMNIPEMKQLHTALRDNMKDTRIDLVEWLFDDNEDNMLPQGVLQYEAGARGQAKQNETEDKPSKTDLPVPTTESLEVLEDELKVGREVAEEALKAVNELHQMLVKSKEDSRKAVDKYKALFDRALALKEENRKQRDRYKQDQDRLKDLTSERDEYFERVQALLKENHELQAEFGSLSQGGEEENGYYDGNPQDYPPVDRDRSFERDSSRPWSRPPDRMDSYRGQSSYFGTGRGTPPRELSNERLSASGYYDNGYDGNGYGGGANGGYTNGHGNGGYGNGYDSTAYGYGDDVSPPPFLPHGANGNGGVGLRR
eukprot:TRINITY_DN34876_c0_g1_i1.p1 TRINITY_DN34876_c0_g1~~TRINITY_DN34876_c0_g1_i1.p1  ORF type:complete len:1121 (-),score=345.02 TRINITY_DN34876_c0_g1_i1:157-3519(-)